MGNIKLCNEHICNLTWGGGGQIAQKQRPLFLPSSSHFTAPDLCKP